MLLLHFIIILLLVFLCILCAILIRIVKKSKLNTSFNEPSTTFRILYALYTSSVGRVIHWAQLSQYRSNSRSEPHTKRCSKLEEYGNFGVFYIPFLEDNYSYFIIDRCSGETAVVDPADASAVIEAWNFLSSLDALATTKLDLKMILCTHHHMDHAGGNLAIKNKFPKAQVIAGESETVLGQTQFASHLEIFRLGQKTSIQVLHTPFHTSGHVSFLVNSEGSVTAETNIPALFSGDSLFVGGCGK